MFSENGFCHAGAHSAGPNEPQNCGDQMDQPNNQTAHAQSYQALQSLECQPNLQFAMDAPRSFAQDTERMPPSYVSGYQIKVSCIWLIHVVPWQLFISN